MSHFLGFNPSNSKLDKSVRQAIESAIVKKELSDKSLKGLFQPSVQFVTEENQTVPSYDPNKTKELLEGKGYQLNQDGIYEKNGEKLEFNLFLSNFRIPKLERKKRKS